MNKIATLFFTSVLSLSALEWHSYEEALQLAKKSTKLIMIDVVRTNCHYCENMDKAVFQDKAMSQWLDERFIAVKLNLDKDTMPLGIEVHMTPTFYFINKDETVVKKVPGSWNIEDFQSLTKDLK